MHRRLRRGLRAAARMGKGPSATARTGLGGHALRLEQARKTSAAAGHGCENL